MSFLSGFLSGQGEQGGQESPLTRARAQQLGVQVPSPSRGLGRGARRSPSPNPQVGRQFFGATMAAPTPELEELRRIAESAIQALAAATANQGRTRKPELPPFDKTNIEIWICRVSAAYARAGIQDAKTKFAYLESKFEAGFNPKINEFLYGPATDETWNAFLEYLRAEYGSTPRQEAEYLLRPLQRNGLRPSQLLATLTEKTKKVTLDDLRKEKVIQALPSDIQKSIVDKVESLTAEETATLADRFFDKEGKPLQPAASAPINHVVSEPKFTGAFTEPEDVNYEDINAIPFRQRLGQPQRRKFVPDTKPKGSSQPRQQQPKVTSKPLCWRHAKFGKNAQYCEEGCALFTEDQAKANAGRRA